MPIKASSSLLPDPQGVAHATKGLKTSPLKQRGGIKRYSAKFAIFVNPWRRKAELFKENKIHKKSIQQLSKVVKLRGDEIRHLNEKIIDLTKSILRISTKAADQDDRIATLINETALLRKSLESLSEVAEDRKRRILMLSTENSHLAKSVKRVSGVAESRAGRIEDLTARNSTLARTLKELYAESASRASRIELHAKENVALRSRIKVLEAKLPLNQGPPQSIGFSEAERYFERFRDQVPELAQVELVDVSTSALLKRHKVTGGVCVVGSKARALPEASVQKFRDYYRVLSDYEFIGIDIEDGANVDVVADLCATDFVQVHRDLVGRFGWVICGALLEHVEDPFTAAANVQALVKPGGHLYYLGPWVHGFHAYPDDYWRFSFSAIKRLFPELEWKEHFHAATNKGIGLRIPDPMLERQLFQEVRVNRGVPSRIAELLGDRTMAVLNIGAIGRRPAI